VRRHAGSPEDIHTIRASSENVSVGDILSTVGPVRLFSIDGGHTKEIVINDLELLFQLFVNKGWSFLMIASDRNGQVWQTG